MTKIEQPVKLGGVCYMMPAYNARHQRVLEGQTPDQVVAERLAAEPSLRKGKPNGRAGPCDMTKARLIADRAKEVSQPDNGESSPGYAGFLPREADARKVVA